MLTQARLKEVLNYNPETGFFTNKIRRANCQLGEKAGCINALGYIKISLDGKQYLGHRLAWLYVYGNIPKQIDHINCQRSDNRIENLRPCDDLLNHQNLKKSHRDSKTGILGIHFIKSSGKFRARITTNGKSKHLGCFASSQDAHIAYLSEKSKSHQFSTLSI